MSRRLAGTLALLFCLGSCTFLASCSSKDAKQGEDVVQQTPQPPKPYAVAQNADNPQAVKWTFAPGALTVNLTASPELNTYEGYSHSVLLCVYQLDGPAAFKELSANNGGLLRLLNCDRFDKSVVHFERHFVSPSANVTLRMDRAEGAQFVGLVVGYYDLQPGMVTRIGQFPLKVDQQGWLFWSSDVYNPGPLTMDILLGPKSIQRMGGE